MAQRRWYPTIACADCGGPAKAPNKATRRCRSCALALQARWHDGRTSECSGCKRRYIAWMGPKSDRLCGACFIERTAAGGRESVEGACVACSKPGIVYTKEISVCYPCLTDPDEFKQMKNDIARKYARLLTARENRGIVRGEAQTDEQETP